MPRKIAERSVVRLAGDYAAQFPSEVAEQLAAADSAAAGAFVVELSTGTAVAVLARMEPRDAGRLLAEAPDEALRRFAARLERSTLERVLEESDTTTRDRLEHALEPNEVAPDEL